MRGSRSESDTGSFTARGGGGERERERERERESCAYKLSNTNLYDECPTALLPITKLSSKIGKLDCLPLAIPYRAVSSHHNACKRHCQLAPTIPLIDHNERITHQIIKSINDNTNFLQTDTSAHTSFADFREAKSCRAL